MYETRPQKPIVTTQMIGKVLWIAMIVACWLVLNSWDWGIWAWIVSPVAGIIIPAILMVILGDTIGFIAEIVLITAIFAIYFVG